MVKKQYDSYVKKATFANDEAERLRNFSKAENLMDELPIIPILYLHKSLHLRDEVKDGIQTS